MEQRVKELLTEAIFTRGHFKDYRKNLQSISVTINDNGINRSFCPKSAVAIIFNDNNEVLLGTSISDDDRNGKLCFVGGGVDPFEKPEHAIVREAYEESGLVVFLLPLEIKYNNSNPNIVFGLCKQVSGEINPNEEFSDMRWYSQQECEASNYYNVYPFNIQLLKTFWLSYLKDKDSN